MNPLHVKTRAYRSFDEIDCDLPLGCVAILGTNGAGKSAYLNTIPVTLFGPDGRSLSDEHKDDAVEDLLLELDLEHGGSLYRVRRTYSARGRGRSTLDFEAYVDGQWEPRTCESAKATQDLIERTMGVTRDTFLASAFLSQGKGAAFTEAQPRDRKRILAEVLGLDRYDTLLKRARTDKTRAEGELQQLAGRAAQTVAAAAELPQLERDHQTTVEAETVTADTVADLERSKTEVTGEYQAAREHAARRTAAEAELREATTALAALEAQVARGAEATQQISVARDELAALTTQAQLDELIARETMLQALEQSYREALADRDAKVVAARDATARRDDLLSRAAAAKKNAGARMQDAERVLENVGHATCDRCEQVLGKDAAARAAHSLRDEASALTADAFDLETQAAAIDVPTVPDDPEPPLVDGDTVANHLARVRSQITVARNDQAQRARLEERVRTCEQTLAAQPDDDTVAVARVAVSERRAAVDSIGEPPDLQAIAERGKQIATQIEQARRQLDEQKSQRARIEERLSRARAAAEAAAEIEKQAATLRADLDVLLQLERAFSPNGIPALIVENSAIPYLETEATRILAALGTSYQLELRTQAALKSGDGLRDTLDVVVIGDHGERPYETFSGGERTRINLALRIALARLLAHRRGAESRLLAIDEPEFLDEQGTAALVDVLRDLEGDFDRLYLISHVPALRDAFDQVLTVTKDETGSRIEQGYTEPVEVLA